MKRYNLSEIFKNAHRNYKYSGKKQGKTFGECLKSAWRLAKLQANFTVEAVKERTDKFLAERANNNYWWNTFWNFQRKSPTCIKKQIWDRRLSFRQ